MKSNRIEPKRLVILGGGFASFRLALSISTSCYDVILISPRNHFLFTPLLASTTVGTVEFRSIIEPLRAVRRGISFYQAACEGVDSEHRQICCRSIEDPMSTFSLAYDVLVVGVGAVSQSFAVPGVDTYGLMLKELSDARRIRQRIIQLVERASLPQVTADEKKRLLHFVVVGGGPTGVEFAGELYDFVTHDLKSYFPHLAEFFQITLLEASESLLTSFSKSLSDYTRRVFHRQGIEVRTSSLVRMVRERDVLLTDDSVIPYGALVWSAGVGPTPLVKSLVWKKDKGGRLITDEFLCIEGKNDVYAIGDCAVIADKGYPMTGQVAQQQGKYLARTLNRLAKGKTSKSFRFVNFGMLAYIGGHQALADTPGLQWRGFVAWLIWRSVYITKLVSLKNKIRVLFDWCKTSIFGRDATTF